MQCYFGYYTNSGPKLKLLVEREREVWLLYYLHEKFNLAQKAKPNAFPRCKEARRRDDHPNSSFDVSPSSLVKRYSNLKMKIAVLGATGLVGSAFVKVAIASGHDLKLLVRNPAKVSEDVKSACEVIEGKVDDEATLRGLLEGCDAVVTTLGPPLLKKVANPRICSTVTGLVCKILADGPDTKFIVVSGGAARMSTDKRNNFAGLMMKNVLPRLAGAAVKDKNTETKFLEESSEHVKYTLVRACAGIDDKGDVSKLKLKVGYDTSHFTATNATLLAQFMLDVLGSKEYERKGLFVRNSKV